MQSNCSNDAFFSNISTESDYGSVEPWSLNNEGGILIQHISIDTYKSPCYSSLSEHTFQSKPLPAIIPKTFKMQYEEPLGFTELEPIYKKQRRMLPQKFNPQLYPRKLESLSLTREFLAFVRGPNQQHKHT